jgi:release factor glutamine methyltransferase
VLSLRDVRQAAIARLKSVSPTPALDADMLLCETIGVDRAHLLAHGETILTENQAKLFSTMVERAAAGEPIAYIIGRRGFYDLEFEVNSSVLIPRPETELLLEQAFAWARDKPSLTAADIGTGSGALAVTFADHISDAQVYAVDVSLEALATAAANAGQHSVADRITFLQGDLLQPLIEREIQLDLIMANLPYIPSGEIPLLEVSRYEPVLALDGGTDGLELMRRLISQIPVVMKRGGLVLLEIGAGQGGGVLEIVQSLAPRTADVLLDYAGLERIVRIEY